MSAPTPHDIRVATEALRADATRWTEQAGGIAVAADRAADLATTRLEAGVFQLLVDAYEEVRTHVTDRCTEGRTAMAQVAETLRAVADTYESEEARREHALRHLY